MFNMVNNVLKYLVVYKLLIGNFKLKINTGF